MLRQELLKKSLSPWVSLPRLPRHQSPSHSRDTPELFADALLVKYDALSASSHSLLALVFPKLLFIGQRYGDSSAYAELFIGRREVLA